MKTTIQDITGECAGRIIAVSDVHGHGHYLKGILAKLSFSREDTLIIVGDLIEKGGDSLATVRYCMGLEKDGYRIYMSAGNVDAGRVGNFFDRSEGHGQRFAEELSWTKRVWKCGLFLEMLAEMGLSCDEVDKENAGGIKDRIAARYGEELAFLHGRPVIITCGDYIFVHAGIPTDRLELLKDEDGSKFLKTDAFLEQGHSFGRTVVVGHWPVSLYYRKVDCMNPVFDYKNHAVAIDGGCALKRGGQLNALVIPNPYAAMEEIRTAAYDDYPVVYAKTAQEAKEATVCVKYLDCEVELLAQGEHGLPCGEEGRARCLRRALLRHKSSGTVFDVPENYVYRRGEKLFCSDFTNALLKVEEGEALGLIARTDAGAVVKKGGVSGWYFGELVFPHSF